MVSVSAFSEGDLLALAGERSFARAQGYLDAVADLEVTATGVTATVYGGDEYEVTLTVHSGKGLSGACDCPYGMEGAFCKHCVAVGLVVLRQRLDLGRARAAATSSGRRLDAWLEALPRDRLLALLREQIAEDRNLRRRLEVRATAEQAGADIDLAALRAQIMRLLDTAPFGRYGYVEYGDAGAYAAQVEEAAAALRSLTTAGNASYAMTLAREAIEHLGKVYGQIDDSDGALGKAADALAEAHREACAAADLDPVQTAEWLATHMLGEWSHVPEFDLGDYWALLGDAGRARFAERVVEASRRDPSGWAPKYLKQQIARAQGDVDALVAALAADLDPVGRTHLAIAQELDRAGRSAEALEWAERGLRDTERQPWIEDRLADYVVDRYQQEGRLADVVAVRRERFRSSPSLDDYRKLRDAARTAGCWDTERAAALDLLSERTSPHDAEPYHGGSLLVDVLIDDGEVDAAWRAAEGRANERQWLALADLVRGERPADALEVYRRAVELRTQRTGDGNYREVARILLLARDCHRQLGADEEFTAYLAALHTAQKRKRNLMKILDQHGL
ncbi:SWIM zinc finger family protein [Actinoallomurus vinaceus]|uniref:SWIM zinc finger family protein n=1 Tax=Actinoallomurus vinaceus TaxID=1080074 RepID=A0ABP8UQX7_9ACTN